MIILLAEIIIVILSSWIVTRKYFDARSLSDSVLICFMLFFAQTVLVQLVLGIIGRLYASNVFIAHLLILLAVGLVYSRKKVPAVVKPDIGPFMKSNVLIFAFSVFLPFFLIKAFLNLINPPLSPDSFQFHLAFPAFWISQASMDNPFFVFGASPILNPGSLETGSLSYYPINAQLFFAWLMLPLRNAFLADLGEAPFYIIGITAIYSILKRYRINRVTALLTGFLWALIPNIFKQLRTGSLIDVICAVLFLLVFYTLLLCKQKFNLKNALLFGLSIGLFIGTKIINVVWLIAFTPFICYVLLRASRTSKLSAGRIAGFFTVALLMAAVFGGFMYIKNYVFTRNPLFPVSVKVFGITIFSGLLDNAGYKMQIAGRDTFDLMKILFAEGLGLQFLALILPGTFIPLIFCRYLKSKVACFSEQVLLFATPLVMLIAYRFFIDIYWTRYFFPYLTLGLVSSVVFITNVPRGNTYLRLISFVSILAAMFQLAHRQELVLSILSSVLLFVALVRYKKPLGEFYKSKIFGKVVFGGLLTGSVFLFPFNNKYNTEEFDRYVSSFSKNEAWQRDIGKGWRALNELTKDGVRIAYTGRSEVYPLFGAGLKNQVLYVSVNGKEISPYNKPGGLCRRTKDYAAWRENMKKARITYLFAALPLFENREVDDPTKFPIEDEWASGHPEEFQLVFNNSLTRIYKVSIK